MVKQSNLLLSLSLPGKILFIDILKDLLGIKTYF